MFQVLDCFVEYLVSSGTDSCECRVHLNLRLQAHALQLPSVGMPNALTAEVHANSSGQGEIRHITIGALCRASDEFRAVGGFKKQACMLGLADGALINQHHSPAVITPLVGAR